ncbi:hypothetical protein SJ05684_c10010 [Sinorhizobium sojae CCBAU 05684]|uniref:Uncharacterized protein n=1 Tax=Sinorhizobium sojae CCBAU 05684 TaxID=716928 RepID=A0A249PAZ9_9HYPH|nr:hypothetical protein [Sinorhizobium sojae]ASY62459.1 hypothetical protein SJ05684_c10010 [Sinorhizobium sojae CCBAU 05684]
MCTAPRVDRFAKGHLRRNRILVGKDAKDKAAVFPADEGKNGSWTLLKVMPDVACVIAAGSESTNLFGTPV